jgi:hypothetical protein
MLLIPPSLNPLFPLKKRITKVPGQSDAGCGPGPQTGEADSLQPLCSTLFIDQCGFNWAPGLHGFAGLPD